ncbi:DUF3810 domain-containing protein [Pseudotamlana agarivorans]|uniref:DUF3810 domain-containing protein n=1 Tax=Pseudotamlana agarivorans TaxID=481183 RepID=UPI000AF6E55D|nr:DUF3810 domain-containing protein [Tamlana agarivorans]
MMLKDKKTIIALAIFPQIIIVRILSNYPDFVETYYSKAFYPLISKLSRYILGWIPFSFGDLVYALTIVYGIRWLVLNRKRLRLDTKNWLIDVFATLSIFYFVFHLFWGLNYYRQPLHKSLELEHDYTTEQLISFTERLIKKSNAIHIKITNNDTLKVEMPYNKSELFKKAPEGYTYLKETFPHLAYHPQSVKQSLFSYPLTYMGFSGYLNPFTNEAQVDGLIPIYKLSTTTTHEIAHQLGYAAENEANFIGSMAAIKHPDPYIQYTGYTFGLRFCLNEIYRRDPDIFERMEKTVNPGILKNYKEVREFWEKHQNPAEPLFKSFYNGFLIANKQSKGMQSYNYVVALLVNYFEKNSL